MTDQDKPIALDAYEALAKGYSDIAETKAENGYNEHPAMRACVGDVTSLSILDAGCGPGFLTRDLLAKGAAHVTGIDVSPAMIEIARKRNGEQAELMIADLGKPLPLKDAQYDLIVSSLAIDYVRDWSMPLNEFKRVLKKIGRIVISVQHPMGSYKWFKPPNAFGVHLCEAVWTGFTKEPVRVPDYYRSFSEVINPVLEAGFQLRHLHETQPVEALKEINPRKYHQGKTLPTFLVIDAITST